MKALKLTRASKYAFSGAAAGALVALVLTIVWQVTDRGLPYASSLISFRESLMSVLWPASLIMIGATTQKSVAVSWLFAVMANAILYALVGMLVYAGRYKTRWALLPVVVGVIWMIWLTLGMS